MHRDSGLVPKGLRWLLGLQTNGLSTKMDKMSGQSSTQHQSHGKDHENQHPPAPAERLPHVIPFEDKCICQFDYLDLRLHSLSLFSSPCKAISHPPTRKPQKMPSTAFPRPPVPTSRGRAESRWLLQAQAQGTCTGGCFWVQIRQDSLTLLRNNAQNTSPSSPGD